MGGLFYIVKLLGGILKQVALPMVCYFQGKRTAKRDNQIKALEIINESYRKAKEVDNDIRSMSSDDLDSSLSE